MNFIKHNNPIYYVDLENSTRWDIKYVDISNAPYKFIERFSDSNESDDVLNNYTLNKRITEQVITEESVNLLCVSFRDFLEEVYNSESVSFNFSTIKSDEYSLSDSVALLCNWSLSEELFDISDSVYLHIKPKLSSDSVLEDSANLLCVSFRNFLEGVSFFPRISISSRLRISDQSYQDYTENNYFYWDFIDEQNYNNIYNNTLGRSDSILTQEIVRVYLNGNLQ